VVNFFTYTVIPRPQLQQMQKGIFLTETNEIKLLTSVENQDFVDDICQVLAWN